MTLYIGKKVKGQNHLLLLKQLLIKLGFRELGYLTIIPKAYSTNCCTFTNNIIVLAKNIQRILQSKTNSRLWFGSQLFFLVEFHFYVLNIFSP